MSTTERWLRGPVPDVPAELQPVAHALLQAQEEIGGAVAGLSEEQLATRPGGVASLAFHLFHLAGSTRRLLSAARGAPMLAEDRENRAREVVGEFTTDLDELLDGLDRAFDEVLTHLRDTKPGTLIEARQVGRMHLPSTVGGVLFHIAEHAARHAGQVVTTAKLLRAETAS
jgi:uncharacterized damage-inducible protein DinB